MHSLADREEALKHDRGYIGKRYVTVRVVSEQAMHELMSKNEDKVRCSQSRVLLMLILFASIEHIEMLTTLLKLL